MMIYSNSPHLGEAGSPFSLPVTASQDHKLMFAARVRNGFVPSLRTAVFRKFKGLETRKCPFANLPESEKGTLGWGTYCSRHGEMYLAKAKTCRSNRICGMDAG
jgi:hypothetical protein